MAYRQQLWGFAALVGVTLGACTPQAEPDFFSPANADVLCGPCGSLSTGNFTISGDASLDGFFMAVATFRSNVLQAQADFDGEVLAIAEAFGVETQGVVVNADFVASLNDVIQAEIQAHTAGGLSVRYTRPRCEANAELALQVQASCEAAAGCDVEVTPGEVAVACDGMCTGECSGTCSGELACAVEVAAVTCEGMCEGACNFDVAASCEGTCYGGCEGECSLTDAEGDCVGTCTGLCTGSCELQAAASCSGACTGTCLVEPDSAACTAEASCRGTCEGECTGTCEGSFDPPSAAANCESTAGCKGQAQAQAEVSVSCSPPVLELDYAFKAGLSSEQKSMFLYRLGALKTHGQAALQVGARLLALFTGEVSGELVFDPPPFVGLVEQVEGILDGSLDGLDLPTARLPCVVPAFSEVQTILAEVGSAANQTVPTQVEFLKIFGEL